MKLSFAIFFSFFLLIGCIDKGSDEKKSQEELDQAKAALQEKNFGKVVEITINLVAKEPRNAEAFYIKSQAEALSGSVNAAIASLESAINAGFKDFNAISINKNFDAIRDKEQFVELIEKNDPNYQKKSKTKITAGDVSISEGDDGEEIKAGDVTIKIDQ